MSAEGNANGLVRIDRAEPIATLVLDKPPVNALYLDLFSAVTSALDALEEDEQVRVVILSGSEQVFCGGLDLKAVSRAGPDEVLELMEAGYRFFQNLERYPKPTIAALRGYVLGGGLGLALACDLRIAGEGAILGLPESRIGFPLIWGVTHLYLRTLSRGPALDLLLTGRNIGAREAQALNLVRGVVPDDRVLEEARLLATDIARNVPSFAPKAIKAILYEAARETSPRQVFEIENRYVAELVSRIDLKSRLQDHLKKP